MSGTRKSGRGAYTGQLKYRLHIKLECHLFMAKRSHIFDCQPICSNLPVFSTPFESGISIIDWPIKWLAASPVYARSHAVTRGPTIPRLIFPCDLQNKPSNLQNKPPAAILSQPWLRLQLPPHSAMMMVAQNCLAWRTSATHATAT